MHVLLLDSSTFQVVGPAEVHLSVMSLGMGHWRVVVLQVPSLEGSAYLGVPRSEWPLYTAPDARVRPWERGRPPVVTRRSLPGTVMLMFEIVSNAGLGSARVREERRVAIDEGVANQPDGLRAFHFFRGDGAF